MRDLFVMCERSVVRLIRVSASCVSNDNDAYVCVERASQASGTGCGSFECSLPTQA